MLYVERNTSIQVNLLDVAGQSIGSGEGQLTNGAFSFALSNSQVVVGTAGEHSIAGNVGGATYQAGREREFGMRTGSRDASSAWPTARAAKAES